jgi:hypothetical protein
MNRPAIAPSSLRCETGPGSRSHALTYAAVMLRLYIPMSRILGPPFEPSYQAISWLCWVPNLVVVEWIILRFPVRRNGGHR